MAFFVVAAFEKLRAEKKIEEERIKLPKRQTDGKASAEKCLLPLLLSLTNTSSVCLFLFCLLLPFSSSSPSSDSHSEFHPCGLISLMSAQSCFTPIFFYITLVLLRLTTTGWLLSNKYATGTTPFKYS